jgi:hypothetical protein
MVGVRGLVGRALSGIDVACWDVLAKAAGVPLATLLGGQPSPIPAYNSNGLGIMSAGEAADEALELLDEGFPVVKVRLGHPTLEADVATVRDIRKRIPGSAMLMSDYNHSLSVAEAYVAEGHSTPRDCTGSRSRLPTTTSGATRASPLRSQRRSSSGKLHPRAGDGDRDHGWGRGLRHAGPGAHRRRDGLDEGGRLGGKGPTTRCPRTCWPKSAPIFSP